MQSNPFGLKVSNVHWWQILHQDQGDLPPEFVLQVSLLRWPMQRPGNLLTSTCYSNRKMKGRDTLPSWPSRACKNHWGVFFKTCMALLYLFPCPAGKTPLQRDYSRFREHQEGVDQKQDGKWGWNHWYLGNVWKMVWGLQLLGRAFGTDTLQELCFISQASWLPSWSQKIL
jgi:hypothetical protein